jgi:hypothetical protein
MTFFRAKLRPVLILGIVLLSLFVPVMGVSAADPVVKFPDFGLEAAIRDAIKKPSGDIYRSDLQAITKISVNYRQIVNLSGLEYCTNCTDMDLRENLITDISPLGSLVNLNYLSLGDNQISDISPLSSLTNLRELDLYNNQISNIQPLSSLNQLTLIDLSNNRIVSISPLSSLKELTALSLFDNKISDITPLASLDKLTVIYLDSNQIADIAPLAANRGMSSNTLISVMDNPLNSKSINTYIPQLQDRGITVSYYGSAGAQTTATFKPAAKELPLIPDLSQRVWIFIGAGSVFAVILLIILIFFLPQHYHRLKKFEITDINEITEAARFRTFHDNTKEIAHNDIGLGVFCIIGGAVYVYLLGGLNIILVGIGLLLLAVGIWLKVTQSRTGLIFSIILILVFGGWIVGNAVLYIIGVVTALVNGDDYGVLTSSVVISLVIWIPFWFSFIKKTVIDAVKMFKNYAPKTVLKPANEALRKYDTLKKAIIYANHKKESDSVRFTTNSFQIAWRGKLDRCYGLLLSKSGDDFRIIRPEDIDVWDSAAAGTPLPAENNKDMNVALNEVVYNCSTDALSRARLRAWKKGTPLT